MIPGCELIFSVLLEECVHVVDANRIFGEFAAESNASYLYQHFEGKMTSSFNSEHTARSQACRKVAIELHLCGLLKGLLCAALFFKFAHNYFG